MTHKNVFLVVLGLLSAFSAFGSEKQPSRLKKATQVAGYGCVGTLGGVGLCGIGKLYHGNARFSQEDLPFFCIAGGIGLVVGLGVGFRQVRKNAYLIPNSPAPQLSRKDHPKLTLKE